MSNWYYRLAVDTVSVSSNVAEAAPRVIYGEGQFICLQNDVDSYQWGYDDKTTLQPTILAGETNQTYTNTDPDPAKYYWVNVNHNGCLQKAYTETPTGITNVNTGATTIKLYPNPATETVHVELTTKMSGAMEVTVTDLLGQKLSTAPLVNGKATLNVANLPGGTYFVNCYSNGIKINVSKIIKK